MSTPTSVLTVYGIPNCGTVKKARAWLTAQEFPHAFHDFKKQGVPPDALAHWVQALGWEPLLNRRGTTWRGLSAAQQASIVNAASAMTLMQEQPSVIKRPVVQWSDGVSVGFDADQWAARAAKI